jgi:hypothetical protein
MANDPENSTLLISVMEQQVNVFILEENITIQ